jgi:hypothetical protein
MAKDNKTEDIKTIKECFDVVLSGDKKESRLAARRVRKLLYSSQGERDKYQDIKNIVNEAAGKYTEITEDWRQEDFVVAISVIYYLHDREEEPDFLFPWFFQLLQHSNGTIRYAAVRMLSNELGPLTVHIRIPGHKSDRLKPEQADHILKSLFMGLHGLMTALWEPKFKRYKYIDSLPAGPYKSVQMVLAKMEEYCGRKYLDRLS